MLFRSFISPIQSIEHPYPTGFSSISENTDRNPSVLICRFVGFPLILNKCPYLKNKVSITKNEEKNRKDRIKKGKGGDGNEKNILAVLEPPRSYKEWALQQKQKSESDFKRKGTNDDVAKDSHNRTVHSSTSQKGIGNVMISESNPLMCVSKHWAAASRLALHHEWRRGACAEWRVLGEVMGNERVTKVHRTQQNRETVRIFLRFLPLPSSYSD